MSEEYVNVGTEGHVDYVNPPQKLTQSQVDEVCAKAKSLWEDKLSESGLSQEEFITQDDTGWVVNFLAYMELAKRNVEKEGLVMREVVSGVGIDLGESDE